MRGRFRGVTAGAAVFVLWGAGVPRLKESMTRVFVAGCDGSDWKPTGPRLVAAGPEGHGMTRSESKQAMLSKLGAVPVVADALDPDQVAEVVGRARPDVIVHQLTAIGSLDLRYFDHGSRRPTACGPRGRITCCRPDRR